MSDERLGSVVGLGDWWSRLTVLGSVVAFWGVQQTWVHYRLTDWFMGGPEEANVSSAVGSFAGGGSPGGIVVIAALVAIVVGLRYRPRGGAVSVTTAASVAMMAGAVWGVVAPASVAVTMDTSQSGIRFTPGVGIAASLLGAFVVLAGAITVQLTAAADVRGPGPEWRSESPDRPS